MRKKIGILMLLLTPMLLASCGKHNDGPDEPIIKTKTQLYVSNFNGGYGDTWLRALKARFEEKYATTSFEPDKTGVQVVIDNNKTQGDTLLSSIPYSNNNVYFCESVFYFDYLNADVMADITDVVNKDLTEYGDTGTIFDKFSDQQKSVYKTTDNKVYGIPNYLGFFGITCDINLWETKKLYIAADPDNKGKVNALYDGTDIVLCRNDQTKRSNGPDGVAGTSDDGFPATYKELEYLMKKMEQMSITPFNWTGKYQQEYNSKFMGALTADYEGVEQTKLMFDYHGTANHLVDSIDEQGKVTFKAPTTLTNTTGYKIHSTAGKYYALDFMNRVVSNSKYYDSRSFNYTEDHLAAQQNYLLSYPERSISGNNAIAMFIDGNYWENEANTNGVFDFASKQYGDDYSRANRKIAMIPFPKATDEQVGEKTTLLSSLNSLCFINKNCDELHLKLAKEFLTMANTNESLAEFNALTNAPKALKYTISDEQYNNLNMYGKSVYDLRVNSNIVEEVSSNSLYSSDILTLAIPNSYVTTSTNNPVKDMSTNKTSTKTLFNDMVAYFSESFWSKYSQYFD